MYVYIYVYVPRNICKLHIFHIRTDLTGTNYEFLIKTQKHPKILNCWITDSKVTVLPETSDNEEKKMFMNSLQELEML